MATWITLEELLAETNRKTIRLQSAIATFTAAVACIDFVKPLYLASVAEAAATAGLVYNIMQRTKKRYENRAGVLTAMMGVGIAGTEKIYVGIAEKRYASILVGVAEMLLVYVTGKAAIIQGGEYEADQLRRRRKELEGEIQRIHTGVVGIYLKKLFGQKTDTSKN